MKRSVVFICTFFFLASALSPDAWAADPDDFTGLHLWFKTDNLNLNDADPVSLWPDSSGNGWDMGVKVGSPTYQSSSDKMNGFPAVRFTTNDVLETSIGASAALSGDPAFSLYFVANLTDRPVSFKHPLNWSSGGIAGGKGSAVEIDGQDLNWATGFGADAVGIDLVNLGAPSYQGHFDTPAIISFRRNANTPIKEIDMAIDGVALEVDGHGGHPDILQAPVRINAYFPDSSFSPMNMDVAEVIIYTRRLEDSEHEQIIEYLSKYLMAAPGVEGDYNNNGTVDAADYVVWRKNVGTSNELPNDPDGGVIGQSQYDTWRGNFGMPGGSGNAIGFGNVPEPSTVILSGLAIIGLMVRRRNRHALLA